MIDDIFKQKTQSAGPGDAPTQGPMAMCPMATMCGRMFNKPHSGIAPLLAGIVLIVCGAMIVIEPLILVWLTGAALVLFGIMLLAFSLYMRRPGAETRGR